jgi:hypothetical protein
MKLKAEQTPYSSTVGGGLTLIDEAGRVRFMVAIFGTTQGITKEETAVIGAALRNGMPADGIDVPERA